ncbi:helix-turn-helix domain-containing protein [Actibacterium ureilyticum]|uniref:helix-turn-helix domain-containing protein n=1 Tax=Actibacterium ureilyticum TaxID=1590614 RepID=UPI000BAB2192|nr:helix-turn-helix domain-containing protein [Actibacterium ureilyticum]
MIGRKQPPVEAENSEEPRGFDSFELRLGDIMRGERATLGKSLLDVQRELKIKATYIAAIENADPTAFETPGFVAGYVRSYARYLGLDPEWAYQQFCREGQFATVHGMSPVASGPKAAAKSQKPAGKSGDPLVNPNISFVPQGEALLARIQPGAIGSSLVLVALMGALGYGGWSALKEIQKVRMAPIEQAPDVVAELDPLNQATAPVAEDASGTNLVAAATPEALDRLYRPQALDVPVLEARDGPISVLRPETVGILAPPPQPARPVQTAELDPVEVEAAESPVRVLADAAPEVVVFALRPAWVRVRSADGTVLFEKILDAGESYVVPATEEPPILRAGNSGSVYFAVNGETYGPAAPGAQVVKNVTLAADSLKQGYTVADLTADQDLATAVAELQAQWTQPPTE